MIRYKNENPMVIFLVLQIQKSQDVAKFLISDTTPEIILTMPSYVPEIHWMQAACVIRPTTGNKHHWEKGTNNKTGGARFSFFFEPKFYNHFGMQQVSLWAGTNISHTSSSHTVKQN